MATCVGGLGERDGRARSARGGQGGLSVPKPPRGERPAARSSSSRKTPTNSLTPDPKRPASRELRAGPAGGPELPDKR
jgi:hypothetical protein